MAVLQQGQTLRRFADMRNSVLRLDRVTFDEFRDRRTAGRLVIDEEAASLIFEEGDAPAICVMIGNSATGGKTGEREPHVRGRGAVQSQKFAHKETVDPDGPRCR